MIRYSLTILFLLFSGTLASGQCLTTLTPNPQFVPPAPYPSTPPNSRFWYGSDELWTALEIGGKWQAYANGENGWVFQNKLVFWRRGFDWRKEPEPKLILTGKRLDGDAPTVAVAHANAVFLPSHENAGMMTLISIPTTGCWEITAHYQGHDLSFVVSVETESQQQVREELKWTPAETKTVLAKAQSGDRSSQMWLGAAYEQAWIGRADYKEALNWFRKSAAQGDPDAQNALGQMYEDGEGVERNCTEAATWYRLAAEHVPDYGGAGQGRNNLGLLFLKGDGVPKDFVQAYMWFKIAQVQANLSEAKKQMTTAQIVEAERLATEWERSHPAQ
jgi:hypothetical protein